MRRLIYPPSSTHQSSCIHTVGVYRSAGSDVIRSHVSQRQSNKGEGEEK
jgi:hypothetical protein